MSIDGVEIEIDNRNVPFLTSDPYVLASIEYGNDSAWSQIDAIYQLHKYNWSINGELSAYAEDAMNKIRGSPTTTSITTEKLGLV